MVAPAGSGKTTLLAQAAAAAEVPVAWYTAESSERDVASMLRYLEASLRSALPELEGDWSSLEGAAADLDRCHRRALLILDDLQTLESSPAEAALGRLFKFIPSSLGVLAASRSSPGFNVSRLRMDGVLQEMDAEDLRFRAWEVERLFSEFYRDPLPPEDLARLARRTNGWAAGLHLFHLATRGRSIEERRSKLATLGGSSKLVREYLTDNVLNELPPRLRDFLVATCVLGRLTSRLCDRLLSTGGSSTLLRELEERQLFLAGNEEGGYRCHDVLRSHLEAILMHELGEAHCKTRYKQAGVLLESSGAHADALYSYCRAEEWEGVGRLLANEGACLASSPAPWIDVVPPSLSAQDPWLLLGAARRQRQMGRWRRAMDLYSKAEAAFTIESGMETCRSERGAIGIWMTRPLGYFGGWDGLIRLATLNPQSAAGPLADLPGPRGRVAGGVTALLAGKVREAENLLNAVGHSPNASETLALGARLAGAVSRLLQGEDLSSSELERIVEEADRLGLGWLAWMSRAALALTEREDGLKEAATVRQHFDSQNDQWGRALAGLLEGIGAARRSEASGAVLQEAAEDFRLLGATTLEAWCRCVHALALSRSDDPTTLEQALRAESVARSVGLRGPVCFAYEALAVAEPERAKEHLELAEEIRSQSGLRLSVSQPAQDDSQDVPVLVRCFGEFQVVIQGGGLDLKAIKPRSRQLFRLLAMHVPNSVHREVIGDALWPESGSEIIRRNLQVAVHSVRRLLQSVAVPSLGTLLTRSGDSYRLDLPPGSMVDLVEFERRLAEGKQARARRDDEQAAAAFERALDLHCGDLFIEDGPADWVVMERERCRSRAVEAAQSLADIHLEAGDLDSAVLVCERGLRLDRYQDSLWRKLMVAHQRAGNRAAESKARRMYASMLADLGLVEKPAI